MRRARRTDANQQEIIRAFEKLGATVVHIHATTGGVPDLLIGFRGGNYLVEVKVPKTGRLSEAQKGWRDYWRGRRPTVITSVDDVVKWIALVEGVE